MQKSKPIEWASLLLSNKNFLVALVFVFASVAGVSTTGNLKGVNPWAMILGAGGPAAPAAGTTIAITNQAATQAPHDHADIDAKIKALDAIIKTLRVHHP